jgi:TfoX/Sxy family transcriptional regulator of competence genes
MAYNQRIADRIDRIVSKWPRTGSKKMFGGVCHLLQGNMFCGILKDYLILRLGVEAAEKALEQTGVRPFDITGRPMKGWVMVSEEGFADDAALDDWLEMARDFAAALPPK